MAGGLQAEYTTGHTFHFRDRAKESGWNGIPNMRRSSAYFLCKKISKDLYKVLQAKSQKKYAQTS